jgi:hypothetical protein
MTIQTRSADGVLHNFPDGTDPAVISRAMKDYATKQTAAGPDSATPDPNAPAPLSQLDMVGTGLLDPVLGTAQLGTHLLSGATGPGPSEAFDAWMQKREADIKARAPKAANRFAGAENDPGSYDVPGTAPPRPGELDESGRVLGNLANPMTWGPEGLGSIMRGLGIMQPAARTLQIPSMLRRVTTGAGTGAAIAAEQPVTTPGSYAGEKAEQVGAGAFVGGALPPVEWVGRKVLNGLWNMAQRWGLDADSKAFNKAVNRIYDKITTDIQGGGPTAQDMLDLLNLTPDTPLTAAHAGGENLLNLIGKLQRQPGAQRQAIIKWLKDTDAGATGRISTQMDKALASDAVKPSEAVDGLKQLRSIQGKPLWNDAMAGGSIAPLKQQFQDAYVEVGRAEKEAQKAIADAQRQVLQATAKQQRAGNDVYLVNSANTELSEANSALREAQQKYAQQQDLRSLILDMVNSAQEDIDNNVPGAVWTPRLQQFLNQPELKVGLQTGVRQARQKAVTEGVPMNIGEYAIKGYDANGDAIIGKVPTMRLLAAAKEGLDAELEKPIYHEDGDLGAGLNKAGVHLDGMRRAFIEELDRLNPAYAKARAVWSGDTATMQAVRYGEKGWMKKRPEEIAADVARMTPADMEFARLGLAANLRKRMYQKGGSGNEAAAVAGDKPDSWLRQQIRPFFRSDDEFTQFANSIDAENLLFTKKYEIRGGSQTAARVAEDQSADTGAHIAGATANLSSGRWFGGIYHILKAWERLKGDIPEDQAMQIANIISDPQKSLQVLGGYKPPLGPSRRVAPFIAGPAATLTAQELGLQ